MSTAKKPLKKKARKNDRVILSDDQVRVIKIQFQKDTTFDRFDDLLKEYCRFMELKMANPNMFMAPSYLIDKFWHAHILSTREYFSFCEQYNHGLYLHHDPTMRNGQDRYTLTMTEYEGLYGDLPEDVEIWPENVETKPGDTTRVREAEAETNQGDSDSSESGEQNESNSEAEYSLVEKYGFDSDEKEAIREYLDDYGNERGTSESELAAWHVEAIKLPENNEGFDPHEVCQCHGGHQWIKGEFSIDCYGCRESSSSLGSFSCG